MFQIFSLILMLRNSPVNLESFQIFEKFIESLNTSAPSDCLDQLQIGFLQREEWALRMIDASAKPQSGLLMGNLLHVGNYDECLEINENTNGLQVQGKYCSVFLSPHPKFGKDFGEWLSNMMKGLKRESGETSLVENARLSYGLCLPKICTAEILQNISNSLEVSHESPIHLDFVEDFCDAGDARPYTPSAIFAIVVFSVFGAVIVASTLYDIFVYNKRREAEMRPNLLISFSVLTNGRKLFATKTSKDDLGCLNGMRVISMMWVVLDHIYQYAFYLPHINSLDAIQKWRLAKENAFFIAGSMSVDTFFTVAGLLVVYLFLKNHDRGVKFSLPMFYLHRILRLTPALGMLALFSATLLVHMGNGPFWPVVYPMFQKGCEDNWWSTLIYLQNYIIPSNDQCLSHAWYLAVDTQMYFLSPLVLFPLLRWPKYTIAGIFALVLGISAYSFAVTWIKHLGTTFFDLDDDGYALLYYSTHARGSVYLIGMICGYFVYKTKTSFPLKLTKLQVIVSWILSLTIMFGIIFGFSSMAAAETYSVLDAAFFNLFVRVAWSVAISVIIVLCVNGYGGVINYFLSHQIFTVFIRLNYSIYLLHMITLVITLAQERTPTYFYNLFYFRQFWGDYMFAVGAAVIWTLAFESPVLMIEKIVFGKRTK